MPGLLGCACCTALRGLPRGFLAGEEEPAVAVPDAVLGIVSAAEAASALALLPAEGAALALALLPALHTDCLCMLCLAAAEQVS